MGHSCNLHGYFLVVFCSSAEDYAFDATADVISESEGGRRLWVVPEFGGVEIFPFVGYIADFGLVGEE